MLDAYASDMEKWHPPRDEKTPAQSIVIRLAEQALRAQRLALAKKLLDMEGMVRIHTPALSKQPGGKARAEALVKKFSDARRSLLKGETDGQLV